MPRLLLAALLLSAPVAASDDHTGTEVSVSVGAGLAYELIGVNFAVRQEHFEGYLGLGLASALPGAAAGARYFLRPDGSGFFLGLNLAAHSFTGELLDCCAPDRTTRLFWATLTPGYRHAWEHVYLQAALGGGVAYTLQTNNDGHPQKSIGVLPDAMLAIGARF